MHACARLYLHVRKPFQRPSADALRPLTFEGIHAHLEPNWDLGLFNVVADKVGSLFLRLRNIMGHLFFPQLYADAASKV